MSNNCPLTGEQACSTKTRPLGVCDSMLLGFILWSLVHTTEALAGDAIQPVGEPKHTMPPLRQSVPIALAMTRIPDPFQAANLPEAPAYSTHEFRPRGASLSAAAHPVGDPSLMSNTTVWQRLSDYRNHDRLSLLTLWETGGNSVSLQAGRRGDPTLQWTSRLMGRAGAGRGLLDELFSTSVGGLSRNIHFSRPGSNESSTKSPALSTLAGATIK